MRQGCSRPWFSAPATPTVPDTWVTFALPLPLSICENPPGSIKPQLPQEPLPSPCLLRVSGLPRTQHTPCFPLGWPPWSPGAQVDSSLVSSGGYLDAGHCPLQPCSPRERACHSPRALSLCLDPLLFLALFLVTSVFCSCLPLFHLTCTLSFLSLRCPFLALSEPF